MVKNKDDDRFYRTLYDENGKSVRVPKEQLDNGALIDSNGFRIYDSSHGHCAFCGRTDCRGGCFK